MFDPATALGLVKTLDRAALLRFLRTRRLAATTPDQATELGTLIRVIESGRFDG